MNNYLKFGITTHIKLPKSAINQAKLAFDAQANGSVLWTLPTEETSSDLLSLGLESEKPASVTRVHLSEGQSELTVVTNYKSDVPSDEIGALEKVFMGLSLPALFNLVVEQFPWQNTEQEITIDLRDSSNASVQSSPVALAKVDVLDEPEVLLEDINQQNSQGETRLTHAVKHNNIDEVKMLLRQPNLDVNAYNQFGETALRKAVIDNNTEMVELLLSHPKIDINKGQRTHHSTPLIKAAANNRTQILKLLLKRPELKIAFKNNEKLSAYDRAKSEKHQESMALLEAYGANPDKIRVRASKRLTKQFFKAMEDGKTIEAYALINHPEFDPNASIDGRSCFYRACQIGRTDLAQRMVFLTHPDINTQKRFGFTPLATAASHGQLDTVKFLLTVEGINPLIKSEAGFTAYTLAVRAGHSNVAELIKDFINKQ